MERLKITRVEKGMVELHNDIPKYIVQDVFTFLEDTNGCVENLVTINLGLYMDSVDQLAEATHRIVLDHWLVILDAAGYPLMHRPSVGMKMHPAYNLPPQLAHRHMAWVIDVSHVYKRLAEHIVKNGFGHKVKPEAWKAVMKQYPHQLNKTWDAHDKQDVEQSLYAISPEIAEIIHELGHHDAAKFCERAYVAKLPTDLVDSMNILASAYWIIDKWYMPVPVDPAQLEPEWGELGWDNLAVDEAWLMASPPPGEQKEPRPERIGFIATSDERHLGDSLLMLGSTANMGADNMQRYDMTQKAMRAPIVLLDETGEDGSRNDDDSGEFSALCDKVKAAIKGLDEKGRERACGTFVKVEDGMDDDKWAFVLLEFDPWADGLKDLHRLRLTSSNDVELFFSNLRSVTSRDGQDQRGFAIPPRQRKPYLDNRCGNDVSVRMRMRRRAGVEKLPDKMLRFRKAFMKKRSRHCARGKKIVSEDVMAMATAPTSINVPVRQFHAKNAKDLAVPIIALLVTPATELTSGGGPQIYVTVLHVKPDVLAAFQSPHWTVGIPRKVINSGTSWAPPLFRGLELSLLSDLIDNMAHNQIFRPAGVSPIHPLQFPTYKWHAYPALAPLSVDTGPVHPHHVRAHNRGDFHVKPLKRNKSLRELFREHGGPDANNILHPGIFTIPPGIRSTSLAASISSDVS
ncbi:hypothetical protein GGF31_003268 [Allomyces arbusculus]|nr:hypothetical protein GGF31_003268 [Allomyces arbusculus]